MRTLLVFFFSALLLSAVASASTINGTTLSGTQLTITGTGFSGTPLTVKFNGTSIPVISSSATQIVATLNPVPPPGSYRLTVKAGKPSTFSYVAIPSTPTIVAQVALTNQSATILPTPILTPQSSGVYRISENALSRDQNCVNASSLLSSTLDWVDDVGPRSVFSTATLPGGGLFMNWVFSWTVIVKASAGAPIAYEIPQVNCKPYDLFITVEQLQ